MVAQLRVKFGEHRAEQWVYEDAFLHRLGPLG